MRLQPIGTTTAAGWLLEMDIDVGSLRCMAPSLGIPAHRHYDPSDAEDAALRLEWAKLLFRSGYRLRYPQARDTQRYDTSVHQLRIPVL